MNLNKNEFQNEFNALGSIPRNEKVKNETYRNIINRKKKSPWFMNRLILPGAAAVILTIFALSFFADTPNMAQNGSQPASEATILADINPKDITKVYAAKAKNTETFQAKMYNGVPYLGTKLFLPDDKWHGELTSMLQNTTLVENAPVTLPSPHVDIVIERNNETPIKLKISFSPSGQGYIWKHNTEEIYEIPDSEVTKLFVSVKDLME